MNLVIPDQQPLITSAGYLPAVSVVMPFHPVLSAKRDLEHNLRRAVEKVESALMQQYPGDRAMPVLEKLRKLVRELNYNTHKKSVAIFVSPVMEKVYYLDIAVEERVVIDQSFEIRDLVYAKKQVIQYLVLLLSAERSRMFLGNCSSFLLIKSNAPDNVHAYVRDEPQPVANYSDPSAHKEVLLNKFLHHMDQGLAHVLKAYPFPVFVLGAEKVLGHFRSITHHAGNIVGYVHGNFLDASETEIREAMAPYIKDWKDVRQNSLLSRIRTAEDGRKLSAGIREAAKAANCRNGSLLVVEKSFVFPANANNPFYIKDAVDDVMEKVLAAGGDVEFVEDGALNEYDHIALVRYY